jgi:protease I
MPKVLLVIGDAAEVLDTFYAYFRIQEEGIEVDLAAPEVRRYHLVQHERPDGWDLTQETPGYHLESNVAFRDVNPDDYLGLFITGGRAPEYLRYDDDLMRITRSFFAATKPVASLCHGIEILAAAGVLKGRTATTVPKCQYDVEFSGGSYVNQSVVRSGNLVTARTWSDNAPFLHEFVAMLNEAGSKDSAA